jgi:hypothetical protein
MEGLQELLETLGDQGQGSNSSFVSDGKDTLSVTFPNFSSEGNGLDSPLDSPRKQGNGLPNNPNDGLSDSLGGTPPRSRLDGPSDSDIGQSLGGILSNSGEMDRSPKSETPKTGNSVTFSLPDDKKPDSEISNNKPMEAENIGSHNPHNLKVDTREGGTKPDLTENNWRDSMNEPRPSPCHIATDKDATSFPFQKDNVFAGVGNGPNADVEIGVHATCPHPRTLDQTDGSHDTLDSNSGSETDDLSHDDVINALKVREERMQLVEKLFPNYPETIPEFSAPDGGYAWVILAASFLLQSLSVALPLSFGVFYFELLSYFEDSSTNTAWIGAIAVGFGLGAGKIGIILKQ